MSVPNELQMHALKSEAQPSSSSCVHREAENSSTQDDSEWATHILECLKAMRDSGSGHRECRAGRAPQG
jgi:hypothetical protein